METVNHPFEPARLHIQQSAVETYDPAAREWRFQPVWRVLLDNTLAGTFLTPENAENYVNKLVRSWQ